MLKPAGAQPPCWCFLGESLLGSEVVPSSGRPHHRDSGLVAEIRGIRQASKERLSGDCRIGAAAHWKPYLRMPTLGPVTRGERLDVRCVARKSGMRYPTSRRWSKQDGGQAFWRVVRVGRSPCVDAEGQGQAEGDQRVGSLKSRSTCARRHPALIRIDSQ